MRDVATTAVVIAVIDVGKRPSGNAGAPGPEVLSELTLCLVGGYGRVLDAAGMSEVGTGIRTRMKVRKQNESGNVPDSFFILEESVPHLSVRANSRS